MCRALILLALVLANAGIARGREVVVPLPFDAVFLRQMLLEQLFTDPDRTARPLADERGCNELVLSEPEAHTEAGSLRVRSRARAKAGVPLGARCLGLKSWNGQIEVLLVPEIHPTLPIVEFRVVDSNVLDPEGHKGLTGRVWDWIGGAVQPYFDVFRLDLHSALTELEAVLGGFLPGEGSARARSLIRSIRLTGVSVSPEALTVGLGVEVAPVEATASPVPEPTWSPQAVERWTVAWQSWDAFLTFVIKQAAGDTAHIELRRSLLTVLLDARHRLVEALRSTAPPDRDPVRELFLFAWSRLAPSLRELSGELPGQQALRYASFVAAGDTLLALDALGPEIGVEISSDGLRRLAGMLAPATDEDPLAYRVDLDPEIRRVFDFEAPLPTVPVPTPEEAAPISWLWPAAARAADVPPERWVPRPDRITEYLERVRDLLGAVSADLASPIDEEFRALFRPLMLATAWKESCWRQYVREAGRAAVLESPGGAVGIMQVNGHVWRGFYDVDALTDDIRYNATAGGEILRHYLVDHAIARGEHRTTGNADDLARATYAAYNGGPAKLRRYRDAKAPARLRKIDASFFEKYLRVKAGDELAVASCFGGSP